MRITVVLFHIVHGGFVPRSARENSMALTPVESGVGGLLIGLSAALAYLGDGRIAGISGIVGPLLRGVGECQPLKDGQLWKFLFVLGLVTGGLVNFVFNEGFAYPQALDLSVETYCLGGILVGIGTRAGRGCTWAAFLNETFNADHEITTCPSPK